MKAAEYLLTISTPGNVEADKWQDWIVAILDQDEILSEVMTKSGKQQSINLRDRLFEIDLVQVNTSPAESQAILRYLGSCRHDGVILRPEQILSILEIVAGAEFHLLHIHRNRLVLET
jgi:uncharacterized protein (DUF2344 family)